MRTSRNMRPTLTAGAVDADGARTIRARGDYRDRSVRGQLCKVTSADGSVRWAPPRRGDLDFFAAPPPKPRTPRKGKAAEAVARVARYEDHAVFGRIEVVPTTLPRVHDAVEDYQ